MSDNKAPKRSAADIEQDLARTRSELTDTVNLLSTRLSPKTQVDNAKQAAMDWADTTAGRAASFAESASAKSKDVVEEAAEGDPKAIAILGGVAAGAALIAAAFLRRGR